MTTDYVKILKNAAKIIAPEGILKSADTSATMEAADTMINVPTNTNKMTGR